MWFCPKSKISTKHCPKNDKMTSFKLLPFVIFIIHFYSTKAEISDKRLCVDAQCKVPISQAKTLIFYNSPDSEILSFKKDDIVTVYSKSAGSRKDLWGVEINGKRGYVPLKHIQEVKMLGGRPTIEVDTKPSENDSTKNTQVPLSEENPNNKNEPGNSNLKPNKVQEPYDVVDGTTIFPDLQEGIVPSSTESPIVPQHTAVPGKVVAGSSDQKEQQNIRAAPESSSTTPSPIEPSLKDVGKGVSSDIEQTVAETDKLPSQRNGEPIEDLTGDSNKEDTEGSIGKLIGNLGNKMSAFSGWMNLESDESKTSNKAVESEESENDDEEEGDSEEEEEDEEEDEEEEGTPDDTIGDNSNNASNKSADSTKDVKQSPQEKPSIVDIKPSEPDKEITGEASIENTATQSEGTGSKPETPGADNVKEEPLVQQEPPARNPVVQETTKNVAVDKEIVDPVPVERHVSEEKPQGNSQENITSVDSASEQKSEPIVEIEQVKSTANVDESAQSEPKPPQTPDIKTESKNSAENEKVNKEVSPGSSIDSQEDRFALPEDNSNSEPQVPHMESKQGIEVAAEVPSPANSPVETTTLLPDLEVPQPDSSILETVTPNPGPIAEAQQAEANNSVSTPESQTVTPDPSSTTEPQQPNIPKNNIPSVPPSLGDLIHNTANYGDPDLSRDGSSEQKNETVVVTSQENVLTEEKIEHSITEKTEEALVSNPLLNEVETQNNGETIKSEPLIGESADSKDSVTDSPETTNQFYSYFGAGRTADRTDTKNEEKNTENANSSENEGIKENELLENVSLADGNNEQDSSAFSFDESRSYQNEEGHTENVPLSEDNNSDSFCDADPVAGLCQRNSQETHQDSRKTNIHEHSSATSYDMALLLSNSFNMFLYLITTALSVTIFLFGYIVFDKSKREGPLVAKINKLEKELLVVLKENEILQEKGVVEVHDRAQLDNLSQMMEEMRLELENTLYAKKALEDQVQSLEKELENSTEVGMELNRMLSEILSSQSGSDVLKTNVESLQRQLVEQQQKMNSLNETLALMSTENHELKLEIELNNKKVGDLQAELDKMCLNVMKIEEEKEQQQAILENEIASYKQKLEELGAQTKRKQEEFASEIASLTNQLSQSKRGLELKTKELSILKDNVKELNSVKNSENLPPQTLFDVSELKAELQVLKVENQKHVERIQQEVDARNTFEMRAKAAMEEAQQLQDKYEEADKQKTEIQTKLEVLSVYFKEREAQLQKEISKHESVWTEKQGEATSITERIKFMQEQLQNYKAQNDSLKQEILSQEVELKSQISILEKKAHENWVSARQAERKLEDAKQEAAQLRHRLLVKERSLLEEKGQNRIQSPIEQHHNGDVPLSPMHVVDSPPPPPPLLYGAHLHRDHITKSPPLPPPGVGVGGLPPPPPPHFLPPPHGVPPFMPPPPPLHGVVVPPPPFMAAPPALFPGDHRPPPLGRMSSPPMNSRYSPSSRGGYSPSPPPYDDDYEDEDDRNSSSPSESEYGTSPPQQHHHHHHRHHASMPRRGYSPYDNSNSNNRIAENSNRMRDYKRPPPQAPAPVRNSGRNNKGGGSSGSGHSNESLEKVNRHQSKV